MITSNTVNVNSPSSSFDNIPEYIFNRLTPTQIRIARHILHYAEKSWGYCFKSYQKIADEVGTSYSTVFRTIQILKECLIRCYRMPNRPSKIYANKELKQAFSKPVTINDSPMTVPDAPSLYIKKQKDIERTIERSEVKKPKNRFANVLFSLALSLKEVRIFLKLIKTRRISYETIKKSADEFRKYCSRNRTMNPGALFRKILEATHSRSISLKEEKQSEQFKQPQKVESVDVLSLMQMAFGGKVLDAKGFVSTAPVIKQPDEKPKENIATPWIANMRKRFNL